MEHSSFPRPHLGARNALRFGTIVIAAVDPHRARLGASCEVLLQRLTHLPHGMTGQQALGIF